MTQKFQRVEAPELELSCFGCGGRARLVGC